MSIARLRFMAVALALTGSGLAVALLNAQNGPQPWVVGDVFVAIGKGEYKVFSKTGALKETIDLNVAGHTTQNAEVGGCWFDSQFNLYTADFGDTKVIKHNLEISQGAHTQSLFANTTTNAPNGHSESIVMAVNGDVYVGHGGDSKGLARYRSDGSFVASYNPKVGTVNLPVNWIDLSPDQRTFFITSRGRDIRTFHVPTDTTSLFKTLPSETEGQASAQAFAIRLLGPSFNGNHGLLLADNINIKRLNSAGTVVATYDYDPGGTNNDESAWMGLNLDPDGEHFWAAGVSKGTRLYRFPLASTGSITPNLGPIDAGGNNTLTGVCVMGEPQTQVRPLALTNTDNSTKLIDIIAPFGDPDAKDENEFYSFSTWRLRIRVKAKQSVIAAVTFTPQSTNLNNGVCDSQTAFPNDFDCRFTELDAIANTQCVPFFRDPSDQSAPGALNQHRCAFYRVKGVPECTSSSSCPFDEPFIANSTDISAEIIMNMTNPPIGVFNVTNFGTHPKGNPRLARDPDSIPGNQFGIDSTTAVIDWPAFGSGFPNDYSPVQREPAFIGSCATIISPDKPGFNSGSSIKIVVEAKTGPIVGGVCTGAPLTGAGTAPNNMTLAVAGQGGNTALAIYCVHQSANDCFQESSPGRYQANVVLNANVLPPHAEPYIFSVTSVQILDADGPQGPGLFPPASREYTICQSGCGGG